MDSSPMGDEHSDSIERPRAGPTLGGIHHVTAITSDAQACLGFYVGVLGLDVVKQTVNYDDPTMRHLYLGDRVGTPGSILTFFEIPSAAPARAGVGEIHRIVLRVPRMESLRVLEERLRRAGRPVEAEAHGLLTRDPEGLALELRPPPESRPGHRLGRSGDDAPASIEGVRLRSRRPEATRTVATEVLELRSGAEGALVTPAGAPPGRLWIDDPAPSADPAARSRHGAGSIHHVALACPDDAHAQWVERLRAAGLRSTGAIDRGYFRSIYFREPGGVLIEIATVGPGFAIDEVEGELGTSLRLPPRFEPRRAEIERRLGPLDPRGTPPG